MNNTNLSELKCATCGVVGIAETVKMGDFRARVVSLHSGHMLEEVPFVAVNVDAQNMAVALVRARGGIYVYNSDTPS